MARRRDYSYISPCVKWTLFFFNFIFWLFGMLVLAIGLYGVVFTAQDLHGLKSVETAYIIITDLSGVMVVLGSVIFIVSFAGCVGALRENLCLLKLYFWSLTIFLIAELMFAIACIIFPWKSREIIEHLLSKRLIEEYRESQNTQNFVDFLQTEFGCCGITVEGYLDWNVNEYFNCSESSPSAEKCGVPPSCCLNRKNVTHFDFMCGYGMQNKKPHEASETIYTGGCVTSIIQFLESNLYWAAGVIFGITLFQMYVTHQARSLMDQISLQRSRWYRRRREEEMEGHAYLLPKQSYYYQ
ncbi:tetraspanin-33-like [Penaeus japonicus]|uniref:tetraspanin-33-like n=1 Tax=Penaeus japonicus TaxID=27405 RepID=UPI001C7115C6|nr:tetraspanin-33-like [Penaeus japonicus]